MHSSTPSIFLNASAAAATSLKAKLVKLKKDPESTEKEILATENEITYLESLHENYFIGMNVFRTAKGGRDKIKA